jgi:dTDP-4-amino-4,6-dideoxygalactose transaminase
MKHITDYKNPFDAIKEFEQFIGEYTGAPYVVLTDCCTHAIEMVMRYDGVRECSFTPYTYLSVPMTMHKLGIRYEYHAHEWRRWIGEYQFVGTRIWDSARRFEPNMYRPGEIQCISFGRTKPIEIGRGGCILTDDQQLADRISQMRYDGREILKFSPWADQKTFNVGYHYYMRPEEAVVGLNKLQLGDFLEQQEDFYNYPDLRKIKIVDNTV